MVDPACLRRVSTAGAAAASDCGKAVRRRAANAGDRPHADGQSGAVAAGRAERGAGADHRAGDPGRCIRHPDSHKFKGNRYIIFDFFIKEYKSFKLE